MHLAEVENVPEAQRHQHHLVCRACGLTVGVDCPAPSLDVSAAGFAIDAVGVTFWGLCPACRSA